ncbi:hypothetical protein FOZ63_020533, partial [Perkinsus olseni]
RISSALHDLAGVKTSIALEWDQVVAVTDKLCETLAQTVQECRRPKRARPERPVWWTRELDLLRDRVRWLQKRLQRTRGSSCVRAELRSASRNLRNLKRKRCREHARATLSRIEDPQQALAFHRSWCARSKGVDHTYLTAEELADSLFPVEEADLPEQASA